ncbi:helix-turn-helix domain-containing protein [Cryptosporangium sp. NPDC048952]|uniref:helix-turn-helix domain-containing protein n=1 Tax=Cryptosporangium sp. NPDC048952 TaxID=3363961 RepID=UPI0037230B0C
MSPTSGEEGIIPAHRRLSEELQALRRASGPTCRRMAQQLGWSSSRVSRAETGHSLLTPHDTSAWLRVGATDEPQLSRVMILADEVWQERAAVRNRAVHERHQN